MGYTIVAERYTSEIQFPPYVAIYYNQFRVEYNIIVVEVNVQL